MAGCEINLNHVLAFTPEVQAIFQQADDRARGHRATISMAQTYIDQYIVAQRQASAALQLLGQFCLQRDALPDPVESDDKPQRQLIKLSEYILTLSETHSLLADEVENRVLTLVNTALKEDTAEIGNARDDFLTAEIAHRQGMERYSKLSKKKETEKIRFEANAEIVALRKDWHTKGLHYAMQLNSVDRKQRSLLHAPLEHLLKAVQAFHGAGAAALAKCTPEFYSEIEATVKHERKELLTFRQLVQSSIQVVLTNSAADHHPDVDPTDPFLEMQLAPVRALDNMSGWLFVRLGAIARTYTYCFVAIRDYALYMWSSGEWKLLVRLTGATAEAVDRDDRRYLFEVRPSRRTSGPTSSVLLQAEGLRNLEQWVSSINNASRNLQGALSHQLADTAYYQAGTKAVQGSPPNVHLRGPFVDVASDDENEDEPPDPVRAAAAEARSTWSQPYPPPPPPPRKTLQPVAPPPRTNPFANAEEDPDPLLQPHGGQRGSGRSTPVADAADTRPRSASGAAKRAEKEG